MNVVVCVKHVPDRGWGVGFTADGRVDRDGTDGTLNAADEHAIEAAVGLAGPAGGRVTVLTMGPPPAVAALRRGLQVGAGSAVLVTDPRLDGSDVFATATVLAAAIRALGREASVDLVLTGVASSDGVLSVLPVLLAAELEMAHVASTTEIGVVDGTVRVRRHLEEVEEVLEAPLPVVLSISPRANEPRQPEAAGIIAARGKPVVRWSLDDVGVGESQVGLAGARTTVVTTIRRPSAQHRVVVTDDGTAGVRLAEYLVESGLA